MSEGTSKETNEAKMAEFEGLLDEFVKAAAHLYGFGPYEYASEVRARAARTARAALLEWARAALSDADQRDAVIEEVAAKIDKHIAHVEDNANALLKYDGLEDESRARLLASLYLREAAQNVRAMKTTSAP